MDLKKIVSKENAERLNDSNEVAQRNLTDTSPRASKEGNVNSHIQPVEGLKIPLKSNSKIAEKARIIHNRLSHDIRRVNTMLDNDCFVDE